MAYRRGRGRLRTRGGGRFGRRRKIIRRRRVNPTRIGIRM